MNKKIQKAKFPFRIGADPEFTIKLQDKRINAQTLFFTLFQNKLAKKEPGFKTKQGEIGWDGHNATAELRPIPTYSPEKLVDNIRSLFSEIADKTNIFELSTNSDHAPIGGHIHLELPEEFRSEGNLDSKLASLHKKVVSFYLPILMGEDKTNIRIRTNAGYGSITDYKVNQFGNSYTYEIRCPSAEWMTTPKLAIATLAYIATIYNEAINHTKKFKEFSGFLIKNNKSAKALHEMTVINIDFFTDTFLRKIKSIVKNFEYYKEYKKEIDFILKPNLVLLEKEKVNYNILNGWKLSTHKQPTKKELLSEKQLQEKSLVMDLDKLMSMISIYYNHDTNIEQFVQAIKQRVVAMKWKLKNRYYFFGLKNGIEDFIVRDGEKNYYYGTEQIITKKDYTVMDDTFNRMVNKWIGSVPAKMKQNKIFYIGLPYSMRIKQDIKSLVKFIHTFENNKENKTKININSLVDDLTNKNKESGLIYQIYIKDDELEKLLLSERSSTNSILTSPSSIENIRRQIENLVNERGQLKVETDTPDIRTKTTTSSSSPVLQMWNSQFIPGLSDITVTDNNNEENEDDENDEEDEELY